MKNPKVSWWKQPAGRMSHFILACIILAAAAVTLAGCDSIDTTRPDYTVRLFETDAERSRRHDMRMQEWRLRQHHRRQHWNHRHGIY